MVRFVVAPDGQVVHDPGGRLPGRGMWLSARREAFDLACRKRLFSRAARAQVRVADDLLERVNEQLLRRCIDAVALARRAGQAVCGLEKTKIYLTKGKAAVLLEAWDGAARDRARLRRLAPMLPVVDALTAEELGAVFGRAHAVHGAIGRGALAQRVCLDAGRLAGLRGKSELAPVSGARANADRTMGDR
jgi:predicted RNA-binding protein YlxR (DUF448 family)